jgi:hypothetical protein
MANVVWEDIAKQAAELSPVDKVRLIEWLGTLLKDELTAPDSNRKPRRSLLGLWAELGQAPSEQEIDDIRHEIWNS